MSVLVLKMCWLDHVVGSACVGLSSRGVTLAVIASEGCLTAGWGWLVGGGTELNSVPSNPSAILGTDRVGPSVVRHNHLPIDPWFPR